MPAPNWSMPTLLLMTVRFLVPRACSARMRFSGMPHRPKPPIMIDAPSGTSAAATSALGRTLFTGRIILSGLEEDPDRQSRRNRGARDSRVPGDGHLAGGDLLRMRSRRAARAA